MDDAREGAVDDSDDGAADGIDEGCAVVGADDGGIVTGISFDTKRMIWLPASTM